MMQNKFCLSPVARGVGLVLSGSFLFSGSIVASECITAGDNGVCGLKEFQMTSPVSPIPVAWYFTQPDQSAVIDSTAKAQNIYFASGTASRTATDLQSLLVDGARLDGYYINASKNGSVNITLANHASVDWLEAGGATTNTHIVVDNATLNGAKATTDYDKTNKNSKNYARGAAIYLDVNDKGNHLIEIANKSQVNGRIQLGGAGKHDIRITDSEIKTGSILVAYGGAGGNAVSVKSSLIDSRDSVVSTENAINVAGLWKAEDASSVSLEQSRLFGTVAVSGKDNLNSLTLVDSALSATTNQNNNAVTLFNGAEALFTATQSEVEGNVELSASQRIVSSANGSHLAGNISVSKAPFVEIDLASTTVDGNLNASAATGELTLRLTNNSVIGGDLLLNGALQRASVLIDNAQINGHLYGGADSALTLARSINTFNGEQFSGFNALNVQDDLSLTGGFSDNNVGGSLRVSGGTITAPVNLSQGQLTFDAARLIADTLTLGEASSLALTGNSVLETTSAQLFNQAASAEATATQGFNLSGSRIQFTDSTLMLTDARYTLDYVKSVREGLAGGTLVMTGSLVDGAQATGSATLEDAAVTGAVLANVAVSSDKNRLLIGAHSADPDTASVMTSFGAAQLQLNGTGPGEVVIEGNQSLTLTGALGGSLVMMGDQAAQQVAINIHDGTLNLGAAASADSDATFDGVVNIESQGAMNVNAGHYVMTGTGVVSRGAVNIDKNASLTADVQLQDQGQLAVNGTLTVGTLGASRDATITVGNEAAAGTLQAERADLQGATLFIDPLWDTGATLSSASRVMLGGNEVNGRLTAGQNSLLVLGEADINAVNAQFAASGLNWGRDVTAALAIAAPQQLNAAFGGLRVDGSLTAQNDPASRDALINQAEFGERSLLIVNRAASAEGNAALSASGGALKVADSAMLYLPDAKANQSYAIAKGFTDITLQENGWRNANLLTNKLLNATLSQHGDSVSVTTTAKRAGEVLPGVVMEKALDSMMNSNANSTTSPYGGIRFLSRAVEAPTVQKAEVVKTINSASQLAVMGGVQSGILASSDVANGAIAERNVHLSRTKPAEEASVWVNGLYENRKGDDFAAAGSRYGYDSHLYGLILGIDKDYNAVSGTMRSGVAFNTGKGKTTSRGDVNATRNDFTFSGVSLYQSWQQGAFNVTGDIGYSAGNNDIAQHLPGWMEAGDRLKADVDASDLSVGVTGKYEIAMPVADVTPHLGVRYHQLVTKGFSAKSHESGTVFKTDKSRQDIWQFPVGVNVNKTYALDAGWGLHAGADMAVVFAAGDTRVSSKVRATGINASDTLSAEIMDKTAFEGKLGIKLQKGDMTWGLGYNLNASSHNTGQAVMASYRLTF